jgi:hypothetical protein
MVCTVVHGIFARCAVVLGVRFVWCAVVYGMFTRFSVVHGVRYPVVAVRSGINGVRCGAWCAQKLICGALWWLSYLNVYFVCFCVSLVGRVGVLSLFSASPAQFTQLKHCANVICAKIRRNRIFAAKTLFFEKKSAQKKRCPFRFFSRKNGQNLITSQILAVFPEPKGTNSTPPASLNTAPCQ